MRALLGDPYFELTRTKCKELQLDPVVVSERCVCFHILYWNEVCDADETLPVR